MKTTAVVRSNSMSSSAAPTGSGPEAVRVDQRPRDTSPRRCVVEHQGMRFVHQPDGTIICEALSNPAARAEETTGSQGPKLPGLGISHQDMLATLKQAVGAVALIGGFAGGSLALMQVSDAVRNNETVNYGKLVSNVHCAIRGVVLGALTGGVVAPLAAVAGLLRLAIRPALLGMAAHGFTRWLTRNHIGAAAILKKLQSGDLSRQLEALRQLVARLQSSAPFCAQFKRLAGVEVLLQMLSDLLAAAERASSAFSGPQASLTLRSLSELSKQGDAANTLVELGAVPLLLNAVACGLGQTAPTVTGVKGASEEPRAGDAAVLVYATATLSRIASKNALAQQQLASEATSAPLIVSLLELSTARRLKGATMEACDELRTHAVALAQAVALEPAGKASLGQAGGVEALAAVLMLSTPWTMGQATAAAALHALVRGDVDNQRRLAAIAPAGLSAAINRALAISPGTNSNAGSAPSSPGAGAQGQAGDQAFKGSLSSASRPLSPQDCHAHRADLLALTNVISRYTTPQAALAPIAPVPGTGRSLSMLQRLGLRQSVKAPAAAVAAAAAAEKPAAAAEPASAPSSKDVSAGGASSAAVGDVSDVSSEDWDCSVDVPAADTKEATKAAPVATA